jgi:UPF0755 protein
MPSKADLHAATNPAGGEALYFMAIGDNSGRHVFSRTYAEHQNAWRAYMQRYRARQQAQ